MRRVYVGDVHGCLSELDALLERVEFRAGTDRLCSVGDLVNKGPDSHGVLRRMIDLGAIAVRGNHDLLWLDRGLIEDPTPFVSSHSAAEIEAAEMAGEMADLAEGAERNDLK